MADDRFTVAEDFAYIGRTFAEYRAMFDLDPSALAGRAVLDCAGGPSAFTAVASSLGADPVAVDPLYARSLADVESVCGDAIARTIDQLETKRGLFAWEFYGDVHTRERYLRSASERFLADLGHRPGRYVAAGLPDLPLATDAVSLALVGNFLFLYDDRLEESFHLSAMRELARVSTDEVRVFPVDSLARGRSAFVEPVVDRLRDDGLGASTVPVPYEFQPGANEMLVVSDVAGFEPEP